MYKVNEESFLGWKRGDILSPEEEKSYSDNIPMWLEKGHVIKDSKVSEEKPVLVAEEKSRFDLDGDGDVDADDRKLAAQVLGSKRGRKKKGGKQ